MTKIRHVFAWRVAEGSSQEEIVEILNTLPPRLGFIQGWEIGTHSGDPGDNGAPWDGVLISDFASWADLDKYSTDPFHLEVVATLMPMFADRAVVDYEVEAAG
ncbi:Dabb family protein [Pseudarthrobacter phenanthrenivorans]|uniref:Dabb family protein n=1 Tax=Pseudarthrobacter phenanthrenivorans TaxID=361575 RepID=UPI00112DABAA|nr:Dabb family protein [Pseudarthrobacter phenanthrenivorans]TPV48073.1 Dabb family protein [Pseudarthrobacter phenanthrenivorans]